MKSRQKSAMVEWACPKCPAAVEMHVSGSTGAGHRCPSTLKWVSFRKAWESKYNKL